MVCKNVQSVKFSVESESNIVVDSRDPFPRSRFMVARSL